MGLSSAGIQQAQGSYHRRSYSQYLMSNSGIHQRTTRQSHHLQRHRSQLPIERCFRTLKTTQLKLEPVYHRLPGRIEAHVKICVMALLIERVIELRCGQPWSHIRRLLGTLQASEFHASSHLFFQRNQPSKQLKALLKKLEIPLPDSVLAITTQKHSTENP